MKEFITIIVGGEGDSICAFRTSEIIAVQKTDKVVGVVLRNHDTPWKFNLATTEAAKSLYNQIADAFNEERGL